MTAHFDTIILGAGAAGMMCAAHAGGRTLILDHAKAPGEKIRISGGGRCNFTNLHSAPDRFLSQNPHFAKSALARYTQWDFIDLVDRHHIPWHEKTLGQLFCDTSAKDIIAMLVSEMRDAGADLRLSTALTSLDKTPDGWRATLSTGETVTSRAFVVACGGKSIPKMGATGFGYEIAQRFGHEIVETRPALVPLTFSGEIQEGFKALSGVATPVIATAGTGQFEEAMLFTHRGLSGPAILQISSYWAEGEPITVNLLPGQNALKTLQSLRKSHARKAPATALAEHIPARLADHLAPVLGLNGQMADQPDRALRPAAEALGAWQLTPSGSEGYRTAEVTLGGVSTDGVNAKTMESKTTPGLYFIGEVVDVTGWLGGYNFQWAWSSGWAAGQAIEAQRRG